jgi:hypothetical protein
MEEMKNAHRFLSENLKERHYSGDKGIDGSIILKRILKKWRMRVLTKFIWLRTGSSDERL